MTLLLPHQRPPNEPWLVFDRRAELKAKGVAGMHAFITGVSQYPNLPGASPAPLTEAGLGMRRLSSTALTAYLLFDWLYRSSQDDTLQYPLATCRLLLSPTPAEAAKPSSPQMKVPPMSQMGLPGCTMANLLSAADAWRRDAQSPRDGATFFYFAGHGIQRSRSDQVLLLESFGAGGPLGQHAVDTLTLRNGMAPTATRPDIARTQFYFVDACRNLPSTLLSYQQISVSSVFDVEIGGGQADDRSAPIFFAALPDGTAQAVPGEQTLFSLALLRCLSGEAAKSPHDEGIGKAQTHWHVTSGSLSNGIKTCLNDLNQKYNGRQDYIVDGYHNDPVLCYVPKPNVPIRILVDPGDAQVCTEVVIKDVMNPANTFPISPPLRSNPFVKLLPAGPYQFEAYVRPPTAPFKDCPLQFRMVDPLSPRLWKVRMQ